ncbi:hypothetical protein EG68_05677 [Paragonimus skrjabini miyazakii]|uniref:Annexin n=1 Tax=Paragonimus skrjabini miyazakii TaxID=59628 RepID=A0A8S9YXX4_9TREM|nr:hypothetical protein EG68_05677 [Paragonimus skrjabini miyazakii]
MPLTGGISAPTITTLKENKDGELGGCIDAGTYIELKSETPNARIYFTTDGSKPNPWKKKSKGSDKTFTYKAPFSLRPGRRIVKAMAVHNVTQVESHVVTKQYKVAGLEEPHSGSDGGSCSPSSSENDWDLDGKYDKACIRRADNDILDDTMDNFVRRNADQGFAATNHSGTQINLWGQVPGLNWDVRAPNASNIYGSYYNPIGPTIIQPPYQQLAMPTGMENAVTQSQLTAIATHLTQCIDQTRHMTVAEVRESLKQLADKLTEYKPTNQVESRPLLAISSGHGDLQTQLEHIHRHLLEYTRRDPDLSAAIAQVRIGKVLSADFDEDESSFLLTVQLEKPEEMKRRKSSNTDKVRNRPIKSADSRKSSELTKDRQVSEPKKDNATPTKDTKKEQTESLDKKKLAPKKKEDSEPKKDKNGTSEEQSKNSDDDSQAPYYSSEEVEFPYPGTTSGAYPSSDPQGFPAATPGGYPGAASGGYPAPSFGGFPPTDPSFYPGPAPQVNFPGSAYEIGYGKTSAPYGSAAGVNISQPRTSYPGSPPEPFVAPGLGYDPYSAGSQVGGQYPSGPQTTGWASGQSDMGTRLVDAVKFSTGSSDPYSQPFSSQPTNLFGQGRSQQMPGFQPGFHSQAPQEDIYAPTLKPYPNFNATEDCERLRKAMKGMGTDEKTIIDIMGHRSSDQRTKIVLQFKTMYGKDLIKEFKSELSGHFYEAVEALCYSPADFDAMQLRKAVKGAGTDEDALIEIVCSRTNEQIRQIKEAYARIFPGRNLETDVSNDTSRHFKRVMISLLQANRDENPNVDREAARRDAEELYRAGEKKLGTDESKFNMILAAKSFAHLRLVFEEYAKVSKNDIEKALKSEMSGDLLKSMLAIVRCIRNKQKYFAYQLMKSMKGLGTKDRTLIRIVVSRCEIDMALIKKEFLKDNGKTLEAWITDDTTGDYRKLLLALVAE